MLDLCLGMQANGKLFYATLEQVRHLVICGYSGCGKTELTYKIIEQLDDTQIFILNPLKIYYKQFIGKPNVVISNSVNTAKQYLNDIANELHNRIATQNKSKQKIIVVIDAYEAYDLEWDFNILTYLERIANGEKYGIHLILTTQYTKQPQLFKNILLNSSIICMSIDYRKLFLNCIDKHLSQSSNILAQIIGESNLIELVPYYAQFDSKIQKHN